MAIKDKSIILKLNQHYSLVSLSQWSFVTNERKVLRNGLVTRDIEITYMYFGRLWFADTCVIEENLGIPLGFSRSIIRTSINSIIIMLIEQ